MATSSHTCSPRVKQEGDESPASPIAPTVFFCQIEIIHMATKTAIISIENLTAETLPKLKAVLKAVPGVDTVEFSVERSVAVLDFDPAQSHIDDFLRAVLQAGFKVL